MLQSKKGKKGVDASASEPATPSGLGDEGDAGAVYAPDTTEVAALVRQLIPILYVKLFSNSDKIRFQALALLDVMVKQVSGNASLVLPSFCAFVLGWPTCFCYASVDVHAIINVVQGLANPAACAAKFIALLADPSSPKIRELASSAIASIRERYPSFVIEHALSGVMQVR